MAFKKKGSPYPKKPSPVKHNLPGLRHTDPKKHGEYKQPHVHGTPDKGQGTDPTNEANPTKVKRKYYRQAKRKNSPVKEHDLSKEATSNEIVAVIDEIRKIERKLGTYRGPHTPPGEKMSDEERKKLQERKKYLYHLRETTHSD